MPCNALNIMAVSPSDVNKRQASESIVKEPSRFEMDENEHQLWETLKEAHRQQFQPGTRLKSLNDVRISNILIVTFTTLDVICEQKSRTKSSISGQE
jgi:transcription elongation factor